MQKAKELVAGPEGEMYAVTDNEIFGSHTVYKLRKEKWDMLQETGVVKLAIYKGGIPLIVDVN